MKRRRKIKKTRVIIAILVLLFIIGIIIYFCSRNKLENKVIVSNGKLMISLVDKNITEIKTYTKENNLDLKITYKYNDEVEKNKIISQNITEGTKLKENMELNIVVSLGKIDKEKLASDKINELGKIPIMMYHGIVNKKSSETSYIGGNVDKDGYNRTAEAFREDLEFYYQEGYRMIRLIDYTNGNIDTSYGKSPIVLTFDDGNINNFKVNGLDSDGNLMIDPNCAIGILESFKKKYPDYNVTATFFVNDYLFQQKEYNEKILNWLIDNNYDIGNHTVGHSDLSKTSITDTQRVIGDVYKKLDEIIPNKYVKIIALPFGNPVSKSHANFSYILNGTYKGYSYITEAALRVGWEPEISPYDKNFDKTYMKRCRAYDNNGKDFDIEMVFRILKNTRYISDGNCDTIITSDSNSNKVIETTKEVIYY